MKIKQKTGTVINNGSTTSFKSLDTKRERIFQLEKELDVKLSNNKRESIAKKVYNKK